MFTTRYHPFLARAWPLVGAALFTPTAGCGSNCDTPWYEDRDGDHYGDRDSIVRSCDKIKGYVRDARDCDDKDPLIHPGGTESCNGIDDDCDGAIDPDVRRFFGDLDGDGIGAAERFIDACSAPEGFVSLAGDCDDSDESSHPGATIELCDGRDNDCDGLVDEAIEGDIYYYPDSDGDGYGLTTQGQLLCVPPSGWVEIGGDCDDLNNTRYPGASEICNGLDDDCDSSIDLADPGGVVGVIIAYVDADSDGYGSGAGSLVCNTTAGLSNNNLDCDDTTPLVNPTRDEVCGGGDEDCNGLSDDLDPNTDPTSKIGGWIDADRDGLGDPASPLSACALTIGISANALDCDDTDPQIGEDYWRLDEDGDGAGGIYAENGSGCSPPGPDYTNIAAPFDCDDTDPLIRQGAADPCGDGIDQNCTGLDPICGSTETLARADEIARTWITATAATDALSVVSRPMDVDGDGGLDVWLGAPGASEIRLFQSPMPEFGQWLASDIVSGIPAGLVGTSVEPIVDVNDDGITDVIVGGPGASTVALLASPDWQTRSTWTGASAGTAIALIAAPGDTEAVPRLAIGEPLLDRVTIVDPEMSGFYFTEVTYTTQYVLLNSAGSSLACCTDIEGDGVPELVIGAPQYSTAFETNIGRVSLVPTDIGGYWPIETIEGGYYLGTDEMHLGDAVSTGYDVDGDGLLDILATAPQFDAGAGAGYVFGPDLSGEVDDATILAVEGFTDLALGTAGALADIDGDGAGDVLLSSPVADVSGTDGGAVYLFFGPRTGAYGPLDADRIWYGGPGQGIGSAMFTGPYDVDDGDDVWVGSSAGGGSLWFVPGR